VAGEARGPFCGMGVCYECLVTVNGVPKQRSCMTEVEDNMEIQIHEPGQN
jgi:NADH dehydrogenase/NADH:ubiquinone oxidoreductase subunit G